MSNLSDLLPAGAAAKQLTFTDSGSGIATKKPVILNSDGTVAGISGGTETEDLGSAVAFDSAGNSAYYNVSTYDVNANKVVVAYGDNNNSYYGTAIAGTVSGSSTSWDTASVFESAGVSYLSMTYDANAQKIVIVYTDTGNSNYGTAVVGTVGASTITYGTPVVFESADTAYSKSVVYDDNAQKVVVFYTDVGNSQQATGIVGTVSGTSISFGTPSTFSDTYIARYITATYDSNAQKIAIGWQDVDDSNFGKARVATVSGTSLSFGSITAWTSGSTGAIQDVFATFDSNANKVVFAYRAQGDGQKGNAIVATISGTSISFGSPVRYKNDTVFQYGVAFDSNVNKVVITYAYSGSALGTLIAGTVSGTDITFDTEVSLTTGDMYYGTASFDTTNKKIVVAYMDSNPWPGKARVYQPSGSYTNLTATNFVGVADSAISASAAGSVIVQGGTVSGVSSGTGLSLGTAVEVAVANSSPESITYDTNANKIVLAYQDAGSSYHGYAAVGTVSGTSISFGTPVLINAGAHYYGNSCYDSTNNKVILVYSDGNNSNYLTAIVGTVSGTSISFGSPTVISSQNYADYVGCAYDTNEQKVVVAYKDKGNSNYGTGVVGTVSGTSISFGSSTAFNSSDSSPVMVVYDSNAQKVVVDYWDTGNSFYGTAVVGTVSGTSISFGSPVVYNAAQVTNLGACFDSTNNKVVFTYMDAGNSNYGTALVGTVSGTSISFGAEAVFVTQQAGWNKCAYDTNAQKVIVSTANATDTSGQLYAGTVSGTDISFGTAVTFDSDGTSQNNITYDSSSNQVVLAYQAYSDSYKAKAVVGSFGDIPLTVGTKYYVTTSGGFSSSADTPSVNAGLAISTTSLLLNGDS